MTRLAHGGATLEQRRGEPWYVRDIAAPRALKPYVCPGCGQQIPPGTAHLVVWQAEHLFGEDAAVRDRRHWHRHCWRLA